jgi:cytoskeletal protein CcmA (bactofilin family)
MERSPYAKPFAEHDSPARHDRTFAAPSPHSRVPAPGGTAVSGEDLQASDVRQVSVLGQTLVFKGELAANEDLLIQGRVEGKITHRASNLTIGTHGEVYADIVAQNVIVNGKVQGDIRAAESVVVEPSAHVVGNIFAPRVGIKEGAKFRGSIDMDFGETENAQTAPRRKSGGKSQPSQAAGELADTGVSKMLE